MNRRTLWQAIGAMGLTTVAGQETARAADDIATPDAATTNGPVCGQKVSLRLHESVTTDSGVEIRLSEIKDQRCSADVQCVWAGMAEIRLDFAGTEWERRGYPTTETFAVGLDDPGVRRHGSLVIILAGLSPTPRPTADTPLDEYAVHLILVELPGD